MLQYLLVTMLPAACFHCYINRQGDAWTEGMTTAIFVFFIQSILYLVGGAVCYSLAGLIFAFGLFLGFGVWYMARVEAKVPLPIGMNIVFNYRDWKFKFTRRRVNVSSFDNKYINGFCDLRKAHRTFRRDRVQGGVIVEETGEIIDPMANTYPEMHKK